MQLSSLATVIFLQLVLLRVTGVTSDNDSDDDNECQEQLSCSDCIQLAQCVYCIDANVSQDTRRCMPRSDTSACVTLEAGSNIRIKKLKHLKKIHTHFLPNIDR